MSTDHDQTGPAETGVGVRLAVIKDIARAMRGSQPPDDIVQAAVDSLHAHFPDVRAAYTTVAQDGRVTLDRCSVGSRELVWPENAGELVFPDQVMEVLRSRDLIVIEDTATEIESRALSGGLEGANVRAVISAPVRYSETLVGLLSLDATAPRQWSGHERAALREAADFLADALRDADARRRLEDSELKFRLLAGSSPALIALLQDTGPVYLNPEFVRLSEYTHDELLRMSLWDIIHPDDGDMIRSYRGRRLLGQSAPTGYETRIVTKSGKTIWIDMRASTFELAGKQAILATGLDVTERKLWEQNLAKSEAHLRTLMDHLSDGVGLTIDGSIVYANPAMGKLLGYSPDEFIGRAPTEFLESSDRQRAADRIAVLNAGDPPAAAEYQMIRKDGTTVTVLISSRQIEYEGSQALFSIMRDLTEQRQLEEQLRQTQGLESVGQLAGGVAHNFNNALAAIIGYSELIARRLDEDDPILEDVKQILSVAERSAALTRELLTFSRKERINPTVFDLNEAVESASGLLGPLLGAHIQLDVRLDRSLRGVRADRRQMEQVVTNLALNARDAMPEGGSLTIETSRVAVTESLARTYPDARCGPYVRLTVTDTGTGIDRAIVGRLFEPFFTTKEPGQGVGLGLSMVHGAVTQAGGFVTVDSQPGRGSTLGLYLPVHEETPGESEVVVERSATP